MNDNNPTPGLIELKRIFGENAVISKEMLHYHLSLPVPYFASISEKVARELVNTLVDFFRSTGIVLQSGIHQHVFDEEIRFLCVLYDRSVEAPAVIDELRVISPNVLNEETGLPWLKESSAEKERLRNDRILSRLADLGQTDWFKKNIDGRDFFETTQVVPDPHNAALAICSSLGTDLLNLKLPPRGIPGIISLPEEALIAPDICWEKISAIEMKILLRHYKPPSPPRPEIP